MTHYGSTIKFRRKMKGKREGARYNFAMSVKLDEPEVITICEHYKWKKPITKGFYNHICGMFSHETIHHVLWKNRIDTGGHSRFDVVRQRFVKKLPQSILPYSLGI